MLIILFYSLFIVYSCDPESKCNRIIREVACSMDFEHGIILAASQINCL